MEQVNRRVTQPPLSETPAFLLVVVLGVLIAAYWLTLTKIYFFTNMQAAEIAVYIISALSIPGMAIFSLRNAAEPPRKPEGSPTAGPEPGPRQTARRGSLDKGRRGARLRRSWDAMVMAGQRAHHAGHRARHDRQR